MSSDQSKDQPIYPSVSNIVLFRIRFAQENPGWGYGRIVGALLNLGYTISDQTVGNVLKKMGFHRHQSEKRIVPGLNS